MVEDIGSATDIISLKKIILKKYGNKWKDNITEIFNDMICPINYEFDKIIWNCLGDDCYICCERYINIIMKKQLKKGNTIW